MGNQGVGLQNEQPVPTTCGFEPLFDNPELFIVIGRLGLFPFCLAIYLVEAMPKTVFAGCVYPEDFIVVVVCCLVPATIFESKVSFSISINHRPFPDERDIVEGGSIPDSTWTDSFREGRRVSYLPLDRRSTTRMMMMNVNTRAKETN